MKRMKRLMLWLMLVTILVLYGIELFTGLGYIGIPTILVFLFIYFNLRASKKPDEEGWVDIEVDYGDPMNVVRDVGYPLEGYTYSGPQLSGRAKIPVKLVALGNVRNIREARGLAEALGYRLVPGQAHKEIIKAFNTVKIAKPIVFGGSEWSYLGGDPLLAAYLGDFLCFLVEEDMRDEMLWAVTRE